VAKTASAHEADSLQQLASLPQTSFRKPSGKRIQVCVPIDLGRLEFVRSETRRPEHYVMGIVKFPVEGRNPPFGKQLFIESGPGRRGQNEQLNTG